MSHFILYALVVATMSNFAVYAAEKEKAGKKAVRAVFHHRPFVAESEIDGNKITKYIYYVYTGVQFQGKPSKIKCCVSYLNDAPRWKNISAYINPEKDFGKKSERQRVAGIPEQDFRDTIDANKGAHFHSKTQYAARLLNDHHLVTRCKSEGSKFTYKSVRQNEAGEMYGTDESQATFCLVEHMYKKMIVNQIGFMKEPAHQLGKKDEKKQ